MHRVRTLAFSASQRDHIAPQGGGFFHELAAFFRQFFVAAFDPYRPEQHYMRGPGPACRARRTAE